MTTRSTDHSGVQQRDQRQPLPRDDQAHKLLLRVHGLRRCHPRHVSSGRQDDPRPQRANPCHHRENG